MFSAHLTNYAHDGKPTEQHAAYYEERAKGGAGLIITEEHSTHPTDWPYEKLIHGFNRDVIPGYRAITEAVHAHRTPIFAQINHNGGQASSMYTRLPVWAPSAVADPLFREVPKAIDQAEIEEIIAGDIAACVGLKEVTTGETLSDPGTPIVLERMVFPEPVIHVAVEPKTKADQEKMCIALNRLAQEDPSFRVRTDEESGQTIISGMGELHLEILVDRMLREFKVQATVGRPRVAYNESITRTVDHLDYRLVKQSGGRGQFAHVVIKLEPGVPGSGIGFESAIVGGTIPREYISPVERGVRGAAENGVLAGYPLVNVKVILLDGAYHDVDSSEMAFKIAGSAALKEAARMASPVILEPIMAVEVTTPEEYMGDVIGDLNSRRGQIQAMEERSGARVVKALVPLSEMFGYVGDLR